ncbi:MAG: hypothetical protein ABI865_14600 [Nitrosospira sp.]
MLKHSATQIQNHFCPTLKLKHKERIGARYHKQCHPPKRLISVSWTARM